MFVRSSRVLAIAFSCCAVPAFGAGQSDAVGDAWMKAVTAADLDAVTKLYADDAVAWFPDEPEHKGGAAIRASYKDLFDHFKINGATLTDRHSAGDATHQSHWGHFSMSVTQKSDGKSMTWSGRYSDITELRNGHWVYVADHASTEPEPPKAAAAK